MRHVHGPLALTSQIPHGHGPRLTPAHAHHDQFTLGSESIHIESQAAVVWFLLCVLGLAAREWVRLYGQIAHYGKVKYVYERPLSIL